MTFLKSKPENKWHFELGGLQRQDKKRVKFGHTYTLIGNVYSLICVITYGLKGKLEFFHDFLFGRSGCGLYNAK